MENEVRLIDANALESKCFKMHGYCEAKFLALGNVRTAPTIDPESLRQKGQWVGEGDGYADGELVYDVWYCSECNHCIDDGTDDPEKLPNDCPNCGAKMEG